AVTSAFAQVAPSAALSLAAPLSRLATLSKVQTVALCAALALTPLGLEWQGHRPAPKRPFRLQNQFETAQNESSNLPSGIERYEKTSTRLSGTLTDETALAAKRATAANKFSAWKQHLRLLLTAEDYHWPEDSPFVRIPKSVAKLLGTDHAVHPPGVLTQAT